MATIVERARHLARGLRRPIVCSACQLPRTAGRRMIAGPEVYICESCVDIAEGHATAAHSSRPCSFCGRAEVQMAKTWPALAICASCVELARGMLAEDDRRS